MEKAFTGLGPDKVVVITAGASGIGRATTELLAAAGARVFVADLNEGDTSASFVRTDVTDDEAIRRLVETVTAEAGAPEVLVNAAGWGRVQPFVDNPPEFWDQVLAINLMGPIRLTHKLVPAMFEARSGKIINISSDAGRVGSLGETVYSAAKGGVIAFTKSLAREAARFGVNVNCVCPGPTDTPLYNRVPEKIREAFTRAIPFRRVAQPQEIADAILFFASSRANYVTGQILSVSGGLTLAG